MNRLMRARKKFCRCCVPGHNQEECGIMSEMRRAGRRSDDKRDYERDLAEYEREMEEEDES